MDAPGAPTSSPGKPEKPAYAIQTASAGGAPEVFLGTTVDPNSTSQTFLNPFAAAAVAAMAVANQQLVPTTLQQPNKMQPQPTNSAAPTLAPAPEANEKIPASLLATAANKDASGVPVVSNASTQSSDAVTAAAPAAVPGVTAAAAPLPPFAFTPSLAAATLLAAPGFAPAAQSAPTMAPPIPSLPRTVAAAAAQVVAAHAAASNGAAVANALYANMQNWKLYQLEAHVQLLRDSHQPIPGPVALLLADARRKEEKKTAKRVANRKSACSSRARKKALVEEMTKANARLRRQAQILALLPDLVIAISIQGEITFCSAQVERVLRHKIAHLVGANFCDILTPPSRRKLQQLVGELLAAEQQASGAVGPVASFPLQVVKVESQSEENSDLSTSNGGNNKTSETDDKAMDTTNNKSDVSSGGAGVSAQANTSSDDSLSSSEKNLRKANEALERNVRWHNEKLAASKSKVGKTKPVHQDDVTGASVTANNADARLSSLRHCASTTDDAADNNRKRKPVARYDSMEDQASTTSSSDSKKARKNGNASDDSGYRESSDGMREDTFSSSDETSSNPNGPRPRPLAPACNICLIREDLTTIWCEVTSSIRTRSLKEENGQSTESEAPSSSAKAADRKKEAKTDTTLSDDDAKNEIKELLLCLRPIRDGDEMVDEALRFVPKKVVSDTATITDSGANPYTSTGSSDGTKDADTGDDGKAKKRPPKKRLVAAVQGNSSLARVSSGSSTNDSGGMQGAAKKPRVNEAETEKNAVESLMLIGNKSA